MAEPMLFEADPVPEAPLRYLAESAMVRMLEERHTRVSMGAHRWAFADHVPNQPWGAVRICDFLAVDCYGTYGAEQNPVHGFEIKASRADWLTELRSPDKAEAFKRYCNRWWLVVSDRRIVRDGELPEGWGPLAVAGSTLRACEHDWADGPHTYTTTQDIDRGAPARWCPGPVSVPKESSE